MAITNIYIMPTVRKKIYAEKYFESWDSKIHGLCHYLQSFYVAAPIEECGNEKHYP